MSRTRIFTLILGLTAFAGLTFAQSTNPKQPQPKSQKEVEAIMAMFQAPDPKSRIDAAMELITKFADTDFKATAFYLAAFSARDLGDPDNMIVYSERALEADKQNYGAMLLLAQALAQRTREFDLDKDEKLGRSEKLAKDAIAMVSTAPKPNQKPPTNSGKQQRLHGTGSWAPGLAAMVLLLRCAENFGRLRRCRYRSGRPRAAGQLSAAGQNWTKRWPSWTRHWPWKTSIHKSASRDRGKAPHQQT